MLFTYLSPKALPEAVPVDHINPYLVEGPDLYVESRVFPLSPSLPSVRYGSKPVDGKHLIVENKDYPRFAADPITAKYLRPFCMGREVVRGLDRWCLWMAGRDFDPQDIQRSTLLAERVRACSEFRQASKKKVTRESATRSHLFQENHQPTAPYVAIPAVVSSSRRFFTAAHLPEDFIAGNKVFTVIDVDRFLFAIIRSSMFITWQKLWAED